MSSLQLKGGTATTATQLEVGGPFVLWDGLILVPAGAELLQPPVAGASSTAAPPWSADEAGWETVSTSAVDIGRSSPTGHVPILASSTAYEPTSSDSGNEAMNYTTTALTPDDGPGTLVVQGQPIAVSQVPTLTCIVQACSSSSPTSPSPSRGVLVLGIALVAVVVAAVAVVAGRQPPRRPAPSPNARIYPPAGAPAPPPPPPNPVPPGGPEPDPLGNLW